MTIRREIDGYVFTDTILRCLCFSLFSIVYGRSSSTYPVIYVVGLLGTGKSYFLKYLSFCLHPQYQVLAMDRLIEAVRGLDFDSSMELPPVMELEMLKKKMQESEHLFFCGNYADNSYSDASLIAYFWRAFNKMRVHSPHSISLAGDPEITAEAFAEKLAAYLDSKEKDHRIVFFVDTLLYFLHHDEKQILSFHQLIESLSTYCNQRVWLVTTSFPSLESEVEVVRPSDLTKILDKCTRFYLPGRNP